MQLPHFFPLYEGWAPVVGRIILGLYFFHGSFYKIPGTEMFPMVVGSAEMAGIPFPTIAVALAFLLEFFGGLALILGLHTRTVALAFAGFMVLIALFFFRNWSDPMTMGNFINCFGVAAGLLYVSVYGAQRFAVKKCKVPHG